MKTFSDNIVTPEALAQVATKHDQVTKRLQNLVYASLFIGICNIVTLIVLTLTH